MPFRTYYEKLFSFRASLLGFRIGFSGSMSSGKDRNNLSASKHTSFVSAAILTTGPFHAPPFSFFHCPPLGAVPKKDNTIRLILDS